MTKKSRFYLLIEVFVVRKIAVSTSAINIMTEQITPAKTFVKMKIEKITDRL